MFVIMEWWQHQGAVPLAVAHTREQADEWAAHYKAARPGEDWDERWHGVDVDEVPLIEGLSL